MKTAVMTELRKIRMEERSTPTTEDDEVLVPIYIILKQAELEILL